MNSIHKVNGQYAQKFQEIASNSLQCQTGDFIKISAGFIIKATTGSRVDGLAITAKDFSATNQTVEREKVIYEPNVPGITYKVATTAVATQADVGSFFQMDVNQKCDMATISPTVGIFKIISIFDGGNFVEAELTTQGI